ncbi:MAG: DUF1573 domain-containing protein, partial [Planctomycetota bacterium]
RRAGMGVVITGAVDPALVARPDLRAEPIAEALARQLPALQQAAPVRVLLLDGRAALARELAERFPEFDLVLFRGYGESIGPERHNRSVIAAVYGNRYIGDARIGWDAAGLPAGNGVFPELTAAYEQEDRPSAPARMPTGIAVEPAVLDFGRFRRGEIHRATLTVSNQTGGPVRIGRVYSPCTCFAMAVEERSIPQGGSAPIQVTLHSLELEGSSSFPLFVEIGGAVEGLLTVQASATLTDAGAEQPR